MYCVKCGYEIENSNAKFCPKCGTPIKSLNREQTDAKQDAVIREKQQSVNVKEKDVKQKNDNKKKPKNPHKSKKKWIVIVLIVIVLGIVAIGTLIIRQKANDKQETISESIEQDTKQESEPKSDKTESNTNKSDTDKTDTLIPGSNMSDAVLVPLGTKVFGEIKPNADIWFSFNTGNMENATYKVTTVNATVGSEEIQGTLYDEYGNDLSEFEHAHAGQEGAPATISNEELQPNTTYYVTLHSEDSKKTIEYSLIVKNPDDKTTAYKTVGSFSQTGGTSNVLEGEIVAGSNQSDSTYLDLETQISGTINPNADIWFSFTTGAEEDVEYDIVLVNKTTGSEEIQGTLYDEYGNDLSKFEHAYAGQDGAPATINAPELTPNTTYYINLESKDSKKTVQYSLAVKSPNSKKNEKANLIFEVPFEINETQVQFVANEATFIDEAKAKEVLKPVADAILNAPEHSILIAGTTATDGTQESCVDLSVRRAEAVKNLLVKTYNVSESQIKTIGLGYEKDPFERGADIDGNGNFVESEAKKNRRVVILDADDAIAQQLTSN